MKHFRVSMIMKLKLGHRWDAGEYPNVVITDYGHINEGVNQRNLKIWADVADKICFGRT